MGAFPKNDRMTAPAKTTSTPTADEHIVAETGFHPLAGLASLAIPGLGHIARGEVRRGIYAGGGVLGLFFGGLLIGGIDCVDSREDGLWFIGQALVGPLAFATDALHQKHFKVIDPITQQLRSAHPGEVRDDTTGFLTPAIPKISPLDDAGKPLMNVPNIKGVGKMNELGTLFGTVAGMLNLIVIVDAAFPTVFRRVRAVKPDAANPSAAATTATSTGGAA